MVLSPEISNRVAEARQTTNTNSLHDLFEADNCRLSITYKNFTKNRGAIEILNKQMSSIKHIDEDNSTLTLAEFRKSEQQAQKGPKSIE
ncbi:hypothetical protein M3J09_013717 [Ascochyta lentis]